VDERYSRSAEVYDLIYADVRDFSATAQRLTGLIRERKPNASTLLEAACGTAMLLAPLAAEFSVAGFDLSEEMLAVARAKLPEADLRRANMATFDWGERFDALICMFSSVGYLADRASLVAAYRRFAAHLAPDGVLVVEAWLRPDQWLTGHVGTNQAEGGGVTVQRMNTSWVEDDGRVSVMDMHHLVGRPDGVEHFVERHRMSLVTPQEHLEAFAAAGLEMRHDPEGFIGRSLYIGGLG